MDAAVKPVEAVKLVEPVAIVTDTATVHQAHQPSRWGWSSSLCDCFSDLCSCCAVTWCSCVTTGQLLAGSFTERNKKFAVFAFVFIFLLVSRVGNIFSYLQLRLLLVLKGPEPVSEEEFLHALQVYYNWSVVALIATLITGLSVCYVRGKVRRRDQIQDEYCSGCCEDFCCALWCTPCTQCQIMRHEGLTNGKYDFYSVDGRV